jgi:hypothetical protein
MSNDQNVTCGTCGTTFPDIYPAGRCPYEYDHPFVVDTAPVKELQAAFNSYWAKTGRHPLQDVYLFNYLEDRTPDPDGLYARIVEEGWGWRDRDHEEVHDTFEHAFYRALDAIGVSLDDLEEEV